MEPERNVFAANSGQIIAWMRGGLKRFCVAEFEDGQRLALPLSPSPMVRCGTVLWELPDDFPPEGKHGVLAWIGYASDAEAALEAAER